MIDIYRTHYRIYLAWALQYRVILGLWAIAGVVEMLVALAVWTAVAGTSADGSVGGYAHATFAAYFVMVMIVCDLTHTWIFWMWDWRVREGSFSSLLLRPVHPLHADIADNVAVKTLSMAMKLPVAVAIAWAYDARISDDPLTLAAFALALMLAYLLRVAIESCLACLAFWMTKLNAVVQAYYLAFAFLSGQFAPVSLLPGVIGQVAGALPFQWVVGFPVELALGRLTHDEIVHGLAAQTAWVAAMYTVFRLMWRASSKRYTAVGS